LERLKAKRERNGKFSKEENDNYEEIVNGSSATASSSSLRPTACIQRDVSIGGLSPSLLLLTGPNMGGKSVLLKTCGLCVILSQIGCCVAAEQCKVSVCGRVFAKEQMPKEGLFLGESTLFVEMSETTQMLQNATRQSFVVVLDEMERGTETNKCAAIASAVMRDICRRITCRTIVE